MADDLSPVWNPLELSPLFRPNNLPEPNGLALSDEEKDQLKDKNSKLRIDQLKYLASHPEIRGIIREFFQQLISRMPPSELIPNFVREFFGQCRHELQVKVDQHVQDLLGNKNEYSEELINSFYLDTYFG